MLALSELAARASALVLGGFGRARFCGDLAKSMNDARARLEKTAAAREAGFEEVCRWNRTRTRAGSAMLRSGRDPGGDSVSRPESSREVLDDLPGGGIGLADREFEVSPALVRTHAAKRPLLRARRGRRLDAITTNKTDFFREPHHFHYLIEQRMPAVKAGAARTGDRSIRIWRAGCVRILASDLDTDVLARAAGGPTDATR